MPEPKLEENVLKKLNEFRDELKNIYAQGLVSVILYGSAASGEFEDIHSNLNLLVVLKDTGLNELKRASGLMSKWKFRKVHPLFLTEEYIRSSNDVFPIEFLDMKENYWVLLGKDALKDLSVDAKNLRFQCEQELKAKLIALRQEYLRNSKNNRLLLGAALRILTPILHILRNILRLKGKHPPYLKQDILKEAVLEFQINADIWGRLLKARNIRSGLKPAEAQYLFTGFVNDLEKIEASIDKL